MFSYYGSKSKVVDYYPRPLHGEIIEPFAGSARYSLKYFWKEVTLIDKYPDVVNVWKWLQNCSVGDIMGLPVLKEGDLISDLNISAEEKLFLGFMAGIASTSPRNKVSKFAAVHFSRKNKYRNISNQLHKIKHWKISLGDYRDIVIRDATWYVDAPYQKGGSGYKFGDINYDELREWILKLTGQVIVCENTNADWMEFTPIKDMWGCQSNFTTEAMWLNYKRPQQLVSQPLF